VAEPVGQRPTNTINALVHLYRAEVGRLTSYRSRLDTTTSWAISSSGLVATFSFGDAGIPHAAFLVLMLVDYFFLQIEGRRFRHYEASRQRVYLMESSFYPEVLRGKMDEAWVDALISDLRAAGLPVSPLGAVGWRLRRNYLWLFGAVLLAWILKLNAMGEPTLDPFVLSSRAMVGSIAGELVVAGVALFYGWLLFLAATAKQRYPKGDDEQVETASIEPD
jgi:uncharacterized membrane protein